MQPIAAATGSSLTQIQSQCQSAFTASFFRNDCPVAKTAVHCASLHPSAQAPAALAPPKGAPLVISKPVTSLRSLSRPHAGPFPYGTGQAKRCVPLPAFEIPKRALKLGAPAAPNPCAEGRVLWNPSSRCALFHPPCCFRIRSSYVTPPVLQLKLIFSARCYFPEFSHV